MLENKPEDLDVDAICGKTSQMTQGLCQRELTFLNKSEDLTNGEILYQKYGLKGIRREVESGFPTVRNYSLPMLKKLKNMKTLHFMLFWCKHFFI